jgi:hypothetical protein
LLIVVQPVTIDEPVDELVSTARHPLVTPSATTGPGPMPPGHQMGVVWPGGAQPLPGAARVMATVLVTDPFGPVVPCVLTVMGPDGGAMLEYDHWPPKTTAGP